MIQISHTDSSDKDFLYLIQLLDAELNHRYPEIQHQYVQHTKIDSINTVIVIYKNKIPAACGCFIIQNPQLVEIKRMFVHPGYRRQGLAQVVLKELEQWAIDLGYKCSILETGIKQPEAIALYRKSGYQTTDSYGPYKDLDNSLCFRKNLV